MKGCFVDPWARCDSEHVGARTRIWAFAHVCAGAVVGEDGNIGEHAYVEGGAHLGDRVTVKNAALIWDGVTLEDEVFVGPRVTFTNDRIPRVDSTAPPFRPVPTRVGRGATLGASVTVLCGVTIGAYAFVGAASLVLEDVPSHALVVGAPARLVGWVCRCGRRLDPDQLCPCGRPWPTERAVALGDPEDFALDGSGRQARAPTP